MTSLLMYLFVGQLTFKETCHNWDCKVVNRYNDFCELHFDGHMASMLGVTMPVRQYMWGPIDGFDGMFGNTEITIFFKNHRIWEAYVSQYNYDDKNTYDRWTCKF